MGLAVALAACCLTAFAGSVAQADVRAGALIGFPTTVTVGETGVAASITMTNLNISPDENATNTVCNAGDPSPPCFSGERGIVLTPSCKENPPGGQCTPAGADPGVFRLSPTGFGRLGSQCSGTQFAVGEIDPALGTVRLTPLLPAGARILLPGFETFCTVDFTIDVLRLPLDQDPSVPGLQTRVLMEHTQFVDPGSASARAAVGMLVDVRAPVASPPPPPPPAARTPRPRPRDRRPGIDGFVPPAGRSGAIGAVNQQLLARTRQGLMPNAPALDPVTSWDGRRARYAAYASAATDITGSSNGKRNVYLVKRGGVPGRLGSPWKYGSTKLASVGRGGRRANGDSYRPALDGWTRGDSPRGPSCLAFVSKASNLVSGDSNRRADAFVRRLGGGKLRRIKAPAAVTDVAVAGNCRTIAIIARGKLYIQRSGRNLRRIAGGRVSAPRLTFNGRNVSYGKAGKVMVQRIGGRAKRIGSGVNPTSDHGGASGGNIRRVAYERDGSTFISTVRGRERLMSAGGVPFMTAGATQVMFAAGPYVYLYAVSNHFGKPGPQGYCPEGQGSVKSLQPSARGNYIVFSCAGGAAYLSYVGAK